MSQVAIGLFSALGETTSQRVARIAAIGVRHPERLSLEDIKIVCGSALTQAPDREGPFRVRE
jgi:hypothetical protein